MSLDEDWLLTFESDRLMSGFRKESGLTPKAPKYVGCGVEVPEFLDKLFAGLIDVCNYTPNPKAYNVLIALAD